MSNYTQNVFFTPKDSLTAGDANKKIKGSEIDAELSEISSAIVSKEDTANKGLANGYASLGSDGLVPQAQLPVASATVSGRVELATTAEAITGTDNTRALTAEGLRAVMDQNAGMMGDLTMLADPNADRILFWDDSTGYVGLLEIGANLSLSGTTLSANAQATTDAAALTTGVLANARVQQSNVTQHQAALSIAGSQLTGTVADARLTSNIPRIDGTNTFSGTNNFSGTLQVGGVEVGYKNIPQNSQSANYPIVLTDAGKHILHPSGGGSADTFTIPANASVAFPIGTVLTFVNRDSNSLTIAITADTMYLANSTSVGNRTLGQNGVATAIKVENTVWIISGSGLS